MKSIRCLITLGLMLLFLLIPITGYAESGQTYEVHSPTLNIRSEPAINADIIGILSMGNEITAFEEKYGWVQTYYDGKEAWIARHHLIPLTQQPNAVETSNQETVTITEDGVRIRSGAGTDFSVIGSAMNGDSFYVIKKDGDWLQISLSDGKTGWIASWLTDQNTSAEDNNDDTSEADDVIEETDIVLENITDGSGPLAGHTIVLDPGHGGNDPGAIGLGGVFEKDVILSTTNQIAEHIRKAGATVIITRTGDYYVSLEKRSQISNSFHTDAFVSIHFNAFPILKTQGISTYYLSEEGKQLATNIQSQISSSINLENRGIRREDYSVLRNTKAPAILMELGFITNPYDLNTIQTSDYKNRVGQAITNGLIQYLN